MLNLEIALPEKILTNENLQNLNPEYNFRRLEKKLGIKERRVAEKGETSLDLAIKACNQLFKSFDKAKVDYIIYCTQTPEYLLPTTACILQNKLDMGVNCGAFDFNLGCSGYIYGLSMAKSFIQSGMASNVLLVTAESYSKYIHEEENKYKSLTSNLLSEIKELKKTHAASLNEEEKKVFFRQILNNLRLPNLLEERKFIEKQIIESSEKIISENLLNKYNKISSEIKNIQNKRLE